MITDHLAWLAAFFLAFLFHFNYLFVSWSTYNVVNNWTANYANHVEYTATEPPVTPFVTLNVDCTSIDRSGAANVSLPLVVKF